MTTQHHTHTTQQYFNNLLDPIKPKSKYISQMHAEQYVDTIYLQIVNGDAEISKDKQSLAVGDDGSINNNKKGDAFEEMLRIKMVKQAEKQRENLEHKLSYLSNSINALNRYEEMSSRKSPKMLRESYSVSNSREQEHEWRKEIQERAKEIAKRKKIIQENKNKKEEQVKQIQARVKQQEIQKKKKQILDNVKNIQQRSKKRQQDIKISNQRYKQLKKQKSLHHKLSESFNQKQLSFLQERKKKLAQIRNLHRPLDQLQLKQHQARFLQNKRQKQQLRQRQKRMNESRSNSYQPFYKSVFYQKVIQDSKNDGENAQQNKIQKIKQYAQKIKQQHVPQIDQRKRQEIQQLIQKQKRKPQQKAEKQRQLLQKAKQKGMQYLQQVKKLPKKPRKGSAELTAPISQRKQYPNYLNHTSSQSPRKPSKTFSKILASNADKQEKALLLQYQSQKYEQELKRKQKQVKLLKKGDSGQIDQQYFDMIKAKLDLLNTTQNKK